MRDEKKDMAEAPLMPVYPFNAPGERILLYSGPMQRSAGREVAGSVQLHCRAGLDVVWQFEDDHTDPWEDIDLSERQVNLGLKFAHGDQVITGHRRSFTDGRVEQATIGSEATPLKRVLVHWMNLPALCGPITLHQTIGEGWIEWTGRWRMTIGEWSLTWDQRSDHKEVWSAIREDRSIVMTHVVEISRLNGEEFTGADFQPLLKTLHFGLSFALSRWVAPALPVGFDAQDRRVWEEWAPWLCDPGRNGSLAWWFYLQADDLQEFLDRAYAAFADPDRANNIRMLMAMAVQSNQAGFVEQRIMSAFSGIELLSWTILKLTRGMSTAQYEPLRASGRLRLLLTDAKASTAINRTIQEALATFAEEEGQQNQPLDGPAAVARVRNRLVHPKAPQDSIYRTKGLITSTWLLTRHYLNQLILHWIGYTGSYQAILGPGGWAGDVKPVPWAHSQHGTDNAAP